MNTPRRALLIALVAATLCGQHPALADPQPKAVAQGKRDRGHDLARGQDLARGHDRDRGGERARPRDHDHDGDHDRLHDRDHDRDWREDRREDWRRDRIEDRREDWREDHRRFEDVRIVRYGYPYYGHPFWYGGRPYYRGYYGDGWVNDYGVVRTGQCNTDVLLGAAGAVTGGVIGNRSASPGNEGLATIFGALAGGIIGSAVGSAIDNGDRACMGQSLELVPVGRPVYWRNPRSRVYWRVVPVRDVSTVCREFQVYREFNGRHGVQRVIACRRTRGAWDIRG